MRGLLRPSPYDRRHRAELRTGLGPLRFARAFGAIVPQLRRLRLDARLQRQGPAFFGRLSELQLRNGEAE